MFVLNDDPIEYDFGGSRTRLHVSGDDTGGAYCMLEMCSPAGRATPVHRHEREDETLHMLEGELEVHVDGATHRLRAGATAVLPRGSIHQLVNRSDATARYMVICAPAGFDRFVDACGTPRDGEFEPREPDHADKARMSEAAARFGITLIRPGSSPD